MNDNLTYVLLSRSILDSRVFASEKLLKVWIWCLIRANYKQRFIPITTKNSQQIVDIKRGQFVFGRKTAAIALGLKQPTVYKLIHKLEELKKISIKSSSHHSVITVLNYDSYQDVKAYRVTTQEQHGNNTVTTQEQHGNTDNTLKKDKKVNTDKNKELFEIVRKLYKGTKRGLNTEYDNFKKKHSDWNKILPTLKQLLENQITARENAKGFIPQWANFSTWINQRKWEEIIQTEGNNPIYTKPKNIIGQ